MREIYLESWGIGEPVLLVHGSLATGAEEGKEQRTLADEGFRLQIIDRRGYGRSAAAEGEDFLQDAADIVDLMGDGVHLVGHSYGGLGALFAAAQQPEATLSLTLLEPPAFALGQDVAAARELVTELRELWVEDLPDREWVIKFLKAVGSDPSEFPPEFLSVAVPMVPVLRHARPMWESELPLGELASAEFPKLVVSGDHSLAFDAVCDELAQCMRASRAVVAGAGHEIQFAVPEINEVLTRLWRGTKKQNI